MKWKCKQKLDSNFYVQQKKKHYKTMHNCMRIKQYGNTVATQIHAECSKDFMTHKVGGTPRHTEAHRCSSSKQMERNKEPQRIHYKRVTRSKGLPLGAKFGS